VRITVFVVPLVLTIVLSGGCGGASLATVGDSADSGTPGDGGSPDGGSVNDGGSTLDGGSSMDGGGGPGPFSPVCYNDQGCNADASVSSLTGKCFGGICICQTGFTVQPNGKCGKTPAPDCMKQSGKCYQQPAECPAGSLESAPESNFSCGDLIEAVCCLIKGTCVGPAREVPGGGWVPYEMVCCGGVSGSSEQTRIPICVNGWQTCRAGQTAREARFGCQ
jgi:hypothetical protein